VRPRGCGDEAEVVGADEGGDFSTAICVRALAVEGEVAVVCQEEGNHLFTTDGTA
jgi:hypothetical protein